MASQTLVNVDINANGSLVAHFADGDDRTYPSRAAVIEEATELLTDQLRKKMLVARWVGLDPGLIDPSKINGTTFETNMPSVLNPLAFG
jgi:hypothetical protein